MRKSLLVIGVAASVAAAVVAQERLFVHLGDRMTLGADIEKIDNIHFADSETTAVLELADTTAQYSISNIQELTFGESNVVTVTYDADGVAIVNPFAFEGVHIDVTGSDVIVTNISAQPVEFRLSGTSTDGMFKVYSATDFGVTLAGLTLTNGDGPAINLQSSVKATITLADGTVNTLSDGATYTAVGSEKMKGTIHAAKDLVFEGNGSLNITGLSKHGICSNSGAVTFNGGTYTLKNIASDGVHSATDLVVNGGTFDVATQGDGFDGDVGALHINGGNITVAATAISSKAVKADADINIAGGTLVLNCSGDVEIVANDPSYCTAIKSKAAINISGGNITITNSGKGGKGISADADINITGGTINVTTSGNGATYTNTSNVTDSYSAACIKSDANINIIDGNITCLSKGTAGKAIAADLTLNIGDADHAPTITATTQGARFLVSGSGMNADYANPKVIKSEGNMTINNGHIIATGKTEGGEGLESKARLTINGGIIEVESVDDGINAASAIVVNGGQTYLNASNNDGMDSNGTITINGGLVLSCGSNTPEEGFDCDQNTFAINGGVVIGVGGATSTPTASASKQCSVVYGTSSLSGKAFHVEDSAGNTIINYIMPTKSLNSCTILFTAPGITTSTTYKIMTGGTITGSNSFHGYYYDGTYSGGTQATTFTPSSMVTQIGSSSGGGPGGGRPGRP